jgi:hypothetical protein
LLVFTAPWSQLGLENSVLVLSRAVKKAAFDFATRTTFQSKSLLADG